jgi:PPOX class probable F420-dependent enzyme
MTEAEVFRFIHDGRICVLASIGPDGLPDPLPMWYLTDESGRIAMRTYAKSQKVLNLRRDPRVSVLIEDGSRYAELRGVQLTGSVRLVDDDPELVVEIWTGLMVKYEGLSDPEALAFAAVAREKAASQVVLLLEPTKVVSWDHRKLAGP